MRKQKESGQVFSLISMLMTVVFVLLFSSLTHIALNTDTEIEIAHVERIDELVSDLDDLVLMTVDSSTYRVLNFSIAHIETDGFFTDYPTVFEECFISGQFEEGGTITNCTYGTENVSFPAKLDDLFEKIGDEYNLSINHTFVNASYGQNEPYALYVNFTLLVDVQGDNFAWHRFLNLSREISILGMTDPLTARTSYKRPIQVLPEAGQFVSTSTLNVGEEPALFEQSMRVLQEIMNNSYYFIDKTGLSIAERFENYSIPGDELFAERSDIGITSFVPWNVTAGTSLHLNETSKVQHHYTAGYQFEFDKLRRLNSQITGMGGFDHNLTIHEDYLTFELGISPFYFLEVEGCCTETGCILTCGNPIN